MAKWESHTPGARQAAHHFYVCTTDSLRGGALSTGRPAATDLATPFMLVSLAAPHLRLEAVVAQAPERRARADHVDQSLRHRPEHVEDMALVERHPPVVVHDAHAAALVLTQASRSASAARSAVSDLASPQ